jgi:hypothetical protein
MSASSIGPVLDTQARNQAKVPEVARHQNGSLGECDASNKQIGATDLPELLVVSKIVKVVTGH